MKRIRQKSLMLIAIIFFEIVVNSCANNKLDITGAWTNIEAYNYWKTGKAEEIGINKTIINNKKYLVLTNSITIYGLHNEIHVPGGNWKINKIQKIGNSEVDISMHSKSVLGSVAHLKIIFLDMNLIKFTLLTADDEIQNEINQSFLLFGDQNIYKRCDIEE